MVEKTERTKTQGGPRSADGHRFEVFVRESSANPVSHVGTVVAATPEDAHAEASTLFAWYARDVWVAPASAVHRFSADALATDTDSEVAGSERSTKPQSTDEDAEPRVYEETEGTPTVACGSAPIDDQPGSSVSNSDETVPSDQTAAEPDQ